MPATGCRALPPGLRRRLKKVDARIQEEQAAEKNAKKGPTIRRTGVEIESKLYVWDNMTEGEAN